MDSYYPFLTILSIYYTILSILYYPYTIITSTGLNLINCNHIHYSPSSTLLLCVHPRYNLFAHSLALHTLSHCTSYPLYLFQIYFLFRYLKIIIHSLLSRINPWADGNDEPSSHYSHSDAEFRRTWWRLGDMSSIFHLT